MSTATGYESRKSVAQMLGVPTDEVLSATDAAEVCGISVSSVYYRAKSGAIDRYETLRGAAFHVPREMWEGVEIPAEEQAPETQVEQSDDVEEDLEDVTESAPAMPAELEQKPAPSEGALITLKSKLREVEEERDDLRRRCKMARIYELEAKARKAELAEQRAIDLAEQLETEQARRRLAERGSHLEALRTAQLRVSDLEKEVEELAAQRDQARRELEAAVATIDQHRDTSSESATEALEDQLEQAKLRQTGDRLQINNFRSQLSYVGHELSKFLSDDPPDYAQSSWTIKEKVDSVLASYQSLREHHWEYVSKTGDQLKRIETVEFERDTALGEVERWREAVAHFGQMLDAVLDETAPGREHHQQDTGSKLQSLIISHTRLVQAYEELAADRYISDEEIREMGMIPNVSDDDLTPTRKRDVALGAVRSVVSGARLALQAVRGRGGER